MSAWNLFPFDKEMQAKLQQMNPTEVDQYVQDLMGKMFQSSFPNHMNTQETMKGFHPFQQNNEPFSAPRSEAKLKYSVYETHHYIFVRIKIESEEWLKQLKLTHSSHLLILEHIPENGDKYSISLPSLVKKKGTTAHYKDDMLEVKIPKNVDMQYSEVDVTEIM